MDEFERQLKELIFDLEEERRHVQTSYESQDLLVRIATLNEVLALYKEQTEKAYQ